VSSRSRRGGFAAHHLEWMQLLDIEGPFLTLSVLAEVFPQGLDAEDPERVAQARAVFDAWQTAPSNASLEAFVRSVLEVVLEYEGLVASPAPDEFEAALPGRPTRLRPSLVLREADQPPVLLVTLHPDAPHLDRAVVDDAGSASAVERLRTLLQAADLPLGLATNGRQSALVHAPRGGTTSVAIWETELWFDERLTFRAFTSLLGVRRTIGAADDETLAALFERSSHDEREVTNQLGYQVRRSIEVLVHAFDRADDEASGALFRWIKPRTLYEAAVTVVMRLVFLLAAEARGLLPDDAAWIEAYAVTPLRDQLEETKVAGGEELLERRFDAWPRLLATFRAVHGGVEHDRLRLPGYGGGLFDPNRFSFLEGVDDRALRIPNRTILNILDSLQTLEVDVAGGRERRPLSYSALGVEQIGHAYERLLDHTAVRADASWLGLIGKKGDEPEVELAELERAAEQGRERLIEHLVKSIGKTSKAIEKALDSKSDDARAARLHAACRGDADLIGRVTPLLGVVRDDDFGMPMVFRAGGLFVTQSNGRRSSGTHYTPPSLTEPIVRYALEPLVYRGPADGVAEQEWELRSSSELLGLKVADIAMGSGAFLVAACRYLAGKLVEAWEQEPDERPDDLSDPEEKVRTAKRLVAERCLYGVDKDPLAVDIAKVSLWLETMRKDRPFTFVDHSLRSGDSLLGLTNLDQLEALSLEPENAGTVFLEPARELIRATLDDVRVVREEIESTDALDLREAEAKGAALEVAERKLHALKVVGDLVVGAALKEAAGISKAAPIVEAAVDEIRAALSAKDTDRRNALLDHVEARGGDALMTGRAPGASDPPKPFHWVADFPEVFEREGAGFDAIVGNPPFLGGKRVSTALGSPYREYLVAHVAAGRKGNTDLVGFFFLRAALVAGKGARLGLVATNTVAQGDTRQVGLDTLAAGGWIIYRAVKSTPWPGTASLAVSHIWLANAVGPSVYTPSLDLASRVPGNPKILSKNAGQAFIGSIPIGEGFFLPASEATALIAEDAELAEVVRPSLTGQDLAAIPDQQSPRWVIYMGERDEEEARKYRRAFEILERRVYPERCLKDALKYPRMVEEWWKFWNSRADLFELLEKSERVLVAPRVAKWWAVSWMRADVIFTDKVVAFAVADDFVASVLSSTIHEAWARKWSSTLETRLNYAPTDCYQTFVFPRKDERVAEVGRVFVELRHAVMQKEWLSLTSVYNRIHEQPEDRSDVIEELRRLCTELDRAVADAFGWTDLELDHDFRETPLGLRYTISDGVKTEVLDRLLDLNHARYDEEVAAGLHDGKRASKKAPVSNAKARKDPPLFIDA